MAAMRRKLNKALRERGFQWSHEFKQWGIGVGVTRYYIGRPIIDRFSLTPKEDIPLLLATRCGVDVDGIPNKLPLDYHEGKVVPPLLEALLTIT